MSTTPRLGCCLFCRHIKNCQLLSYLPAIGDFCQSLSRRGDSWLSWQLLHIDSGRNFFPEMPIQNFPLFCRPRWSGKPMDGFVFISASILDDKQMLRGNYCMIYKCKEVIKASYHDWRRFQSVDDDIHAFIVSFCVIWQQSRAWRVIRDSLNLRRKSLSFNLRYVCFNCF